MSDIQISDKVHISDFDLKYMIELSKEVNGDDELKMVKGVISQIRYAEMVSNL